ncbi:hypothetical protein DPMN_069331 [Dreissena polymorpha]|uniref:Uncharacterized protein n=1 Tax=Dreissena polymorpha TaxID=45954 RepID=A0A9D3Z3B8_DREPO|nr:hypothetical protein DPMN_069331 [Dreissena polymorpha]
MALELKSRLECIIKCGYGPHCPDDPPYMLSSGWASFVELLMIMRKLYVCIRISLSYCTRTVTMKRYSYFMIVQYSYGHHEALFVFHDHTVLVRSPLRTICVS